MKLVLVSDTHGFKIDIPPGDILIHAGDLSSSGSIQECQDALDWLNGMPHEHVVVIAGNHDFAFERAYAKPQLKLGRITYLENSGALVGGLKMWGSPVQPEFMNWAFNIPRGPAIKKYWDEIPEDLDILITHGPPAGILDRAVYWGDPLGCEDLLAAVERVNPRMHVFGHIHGGYGFQSRGKTNFVNAAICDEAYRPNRLPWEITVEPR